jgi:hypothetical protein
LTFILSFKVEDWWPNYTFKIREKVLNVLDLGAVVFDMGAEFLVYVVLVFAEDMRMLSYLPKEMLYCLFFSDKCLQLLYLCRNIKLLKEIG